MRYQAGLTLVELMVATTLSLILLAGVLVVFEGNKTTYKMQSGLATLQENGRYAIRRLSEDLKLTGFGGCRYLQGERSPTIVMTANSPDDYVQDFIDGVFIVGQDNVNAVSPYSLLDAVDRPARNPVVGSDWLEVRLPFESRVMLVTGDVGSIAGTASTAAGTIGTLAGEDEVDLANGEFFLIADCGGGEIFEADAVDPLRFNNGANENGGTLKRSYGADAEVIQLSRAIYFVADTDRTNSTGQPVFALYRHDPVSGNTVEMVDGVEDLQVTYSLDTNGDGTVDETGQTAAEVEAANDWNRVNSVRLSLLLDSVDGIGGDRMPYVFNGADVAADTLAAGDSRLRQEFTLTVAVRNSSL